MSTSTSWGRVRLLGDDLRAKADQLASHDPLETANAISDHILDDVDGVAIVDVEASRAKYQKRRARWLARCRAEDEQDEDEQEEDKGWNPDDHPDPESDSDDVLGDESDDDDSDVEWPSSKAYEQDEVLESLNSMQADIERKHNIQPIDNPAELRVDAFVHQKVAAGAIADTLNNRFKGIVVADPPGLGKTVSALAGIAAAREPGDGPCVVVTPVSCLAQWASECEKFFHKGTMKAFVLHREAVPPANLYKYDIIITSYSTMVAEVVRKRRFAKLVRYCKAGGDEAELPKRPELSLFSRMFKCATNKLGKFLILDEGHTIKNIESRTYLAIWLLRQLFTSCVMLTGTPLDNTWTDLFALVSLLSGHPITSPYLMRKAFAKDPKNSYESSRLVPTGNFLVRIQQFVHAVTLRRPEKIIAHLMPPVILEDVQFDLAPRDLKASNDEMQRFLAAADSNDKKKKTTPKRTKGQRVGKKTTKQIHELRRKARAAKQNPDTSGLACVVKAQQLANHPELASIMAIERESLEKSMDDVDVPEQLKLDEDELRTIDKWRDDIKENEGWRSARINVIIDTVDRHRDLRPDDAFIIMDDSVFFLDIIQIALENTQDPMRCFKFDGRQAPNERVAALEAFKKAPRPRVLLLSRGAGGLGLNLEDTNVLIQCAPWWKKSWEEQAEGRMKRYGQKRPVFFYKLMARDCKVEEYKKKKRDNKHLINSVIMRACEYEDGSELGPARYCE